MRRLVKWGLLLACISAFLGHLFYRTRQGWGEFWSFDLRAQYLPFLAFARESVLSGALPLWTPYHATGHPLFAEITAGFFYPVNWLVLLLDPPHALLLIQCIHIVIGMVGMLLYLRHLRLNWPAAALGASLFAYLVLRANFVLPAGATYAWIPFIFLHIHRLFDKRDFGACVRLAAFLTVSLLAGFIQYFYYVCIVVLTYSFLLAIPSFPHIGCRGAGVRVGLTVTSFLAVAGLASVQLVPTLELSLESIRNLAREIDPGKNVFFLRLGVLALDLCWRTDSSAYGSYYFGLPVFLVPFAFVSRKHRATALALLATAAYTIMFVLSRQVPALAVFGHLPLADTFRVHERMLTFTQFMVAVIGAIGLSALWEKASTKLWNTETKRPDWFSLLMGAYAVGVLAFCLLPADELPSPIRIWLILLLPCLLVISSVFADKLSVGAKTSASWFLALLVITDVSTHLYERKPVAVSASDIHSAESMRSIRWIHEHAQQDRVLFDSPEFGLNPNAGNRFAFQNINSYNPLILARWSNFVRFAIGTKEFDQIDAAWGFYGNLDDMRALFLQQTRTVGLASLRYFVSYRPYFHHKTGEEECHAWSLTQGDDVDPKIFVYENQFALPRAYLVNTYVITRTEDESLQAIRENISLLSSAVVLENGKPSFASSSARRSAGQARIKDYGNNKVELEVEADEPSLLVLTDSYYPGWNAYVDGVKAPIWRANSLFRAVEVPRGRHTVIYRYQPASLRLGLAVSLSTLLLIIVGLSAERRLAKDGKTAKAENLAVP